MMTIYFCCLFFQRADGFDLLLLAPLVLLPHLKKTVIMHQSDIKQISNLLLFAGSEVVLNVEGLPDLLGCLSLDHVGHGLAGDIQQTLDI